MISFFLAQLCRTRVAQLVRVRKYVRHWNLASSCLCHSYNYTWVCFAFNFGNLVRTRYSRELLRCVCILAVAWSTCSNICISLPHARLMIMAHARRDELKPIQPKAKLEMKEQFAFILPCYRPLLPADDGTNARFTLYYKGTVYSSYYGTSDSRTQNTGR